MYEVRRTMYDLEVPALAREYGEVGAGAEIMKRRSDVVRKGRGRLAAPVYDLRNSRASGAL